MQHCSEIADVEVKPVRESFWKRRVVNPIVSQLKQGTSPEKVSLSMAWGAAIGMIPVLGTSTALCGLTAVALRLNHIAIQAINWLVYPLQIILIIPFLHAGNLLFGIPLESLSLSEITAAFETDFLGALADLGWLALRGLVAWAVVMIPFVFLTSRLLRPLIRRLAGSIKKDTPES